MLYDQVRGFLNQPEDQKTRFALTRASSRAGCFPLIDARKNTTTTSLRPGVISREWPYITRSFAWSVYAIAHAAWSHLSKPTLLETTPVHNVADALHSPPGHRIVLTLDPVLHIILA